MFTRISFGGLFVSCCGRWLLVGVCAAVGLLCWLWCFVFAYLWVCLLAVCWVCMGLLLIVLLMRFFVICTFI